MIDIRPARLEDLSEVQKLNHAVMQNNIKYDPDININFDLEEVGRNLFTELIQNKDGVFLLAYKEGKLIGFINGSPKGVVNRNIKTFEIENIGIVPEFRRKGVASMLYDKALEEIKKRGYKKLYLNCYIKNTEALEFYYKLGFQPIDISLEKYI